MSDANNSEFSSCNTNKTNVNIAIGSIGAAWVILSIKLGVTVPQIGTLPMAINKSANKEQLKKYLVLAFIQYTSWYETND